MPHELTEHFAFVVDRLVAGKLIPFSARARTSASGRTSCGRGASCRRARNWPGISREHEYPPDEDPRGVSRVAQYVADVKRDENVRGSADTSPLSMFKRDCDRRRSPSVANMRALHSVRQLCAIDDPKQVRSFAARSSLCTPRGRGRPETSCKQLAS